MSKGWIKTKTDDINMEISMSCDNSNQGHNDLIYDPTYLETLQLFQSLTIVSNVCWVSKIW
jgi:hypothetical protein